MTQSANNTNNANVQVLDVTYGTYKRGALVVGHIPANAAVLLYEHQGLDNGNKITVVDYLAVSGVKSTKTIDVIMPLLSLMVGEARKNVGFDSKYKFVVNTTDTRSGIRKMTAYGSWLSRTNVLYKSDSNGALTKAITLEGGIKLSKTALKISPSQAIVKAKGDDLRVQMYQLAEAVADQATMYKDILTEARMVFDSAYATPVAAPAPKASKPKAAKKSTPVAAAV